MSRARPLSARETALVAGYAIGVLLVSAIDPLPEFIFWTVVLGGPVVVGYGIGSPWVVLLALLWPAFSWLSTSHDAAPWLTATLVWAPLTAGLLLASARLRRLAERD